MAGRYSEVHGQVNWFHRRLIRSQDVHSLGKWGEWITLRYLRHLKWDIVARNWTTSRGELDLIAFDGPFLVFVEVKTRRHPTRFPPEFGVDNTKAAQIEKLAYHFMARYELDHTPLRFDLAAIEVPTWSRYHLRHYRGFL